jgi:hypothetical protein
MIEEQNRLQKGINGAPRLGRNPESWIESERARRRANGLLIHLGGDNIGPKPVQGGALPHARNLQHGSRPLVCKRFIQ